MALPLTSSRVAFAFMLAVSPTVGCALLSGLSSLDVSTDGGTTDGSNVDQFVAADGGDAAVPPPDDCDCGVAPPTGFSRVVFSRSKNEGFCPQGTTKESAFADPANVAASGPCSCSCTIGGCTPATVSFHGTTPCSQGNPIVVSGACQASPSNYSTATYARPTFGAPTCTSGAGTFPKAYTEAVTLCTSQLGRCAQFCAPPTGLEMCYVAPGDVSCPPSFTKNLIGKITDTRSCTGCQCGVNPGTVCLMNVHAYSDNACTNKLDAGAIWLDGSCGALAPPAGPHMIGQVGPLGGCSSGGGTASGATVASAIRTVCCP